MTIERIRALMLAQCGVLLAISFTSISMGQTFFDAHTRNGEADFDVDGLLSTTGDLGTTNVQATILAIDLPLDFVAAGVTSLTLDVTASGGNVSADQGNLVEARGLGVASANDLVATVPSINISNLNTNESLTYAISSFGLSQVRITGIEFGAFRNFFPVSVAVLTGATIDGSATVSGGTNSVDSMGRALFDFPVTSFSVAGTSDGANDGFRITGIQLSVVPEPSAISLVIAMIAMLSIQGTRSRNRR